MKKIIFCFGLLLSFHSSAGVLLEKQVTSGHVIPEESFVKNCTIYSPGRAEIMIRQGDGSEISSSKVVHVRLTKAIKRFLQFAKRYPMADGPVVCDAGSETLTGHFRGEEFILKDRRDCVSDAFRKGYSSRRLRNLAREICDF